MDKSLLFIHVPRTGGTTLRTILERQYEKSATFKVYGNAQDSIDSFKSLPSANRATIQLLEGHMPFGLHEFMPTPFVYITLLREPVDRIVSMYHYVIRTPDHYLHRRAKISKATTLNEFVASKVINEIDNSQTKLISGKVNIPFGKRDHTLLEQAKDNIDKYFAVAGLVEEFDLSLLLMKRTFGWKTPYYVKRNVTEAAFSAEDIPDDTVSVIRERNQLDMELYQYAKRRLHEQVDKLGRDFGREVRLFRFLNICGKHYNRVKRYVKGRVTMANRCR